MTNTPKLPKALYNREIVLVHADDDAEARGIVLKLIESGVNAYADDVRVFVYAQDIDDAIEVVGERAA